MRRLTGRTRVVALLGWPVEHSLSPLMQGAAFEAAGLDWVYVALGVRPGGVGDAVRGLRALGFAGANVTIPHKQAVIPYLDALDAGAQQIGAVNTIQIEGDGRLIGYNTDADGGYEALLQEIGFTPAGARVVVLGAGGAARALAFGAAMRQARSLSILNRAIEKDQAIALATDVGRSFPETETVGLAWEDEEARARVAAAELIVQATPLGMKPGDPLPIPIEWVPSGIAVFDAVYTPERTAFLEGCRLQRHCRAVGGVGMLLHQGAAAFRIWTGRDPDLAVMAGALRAALQPANA